VPLVGSSFVGTFDFESPEFDWGEHLSFFFLLPFFSFFFFDLGIFSSLPNTPLIVIMIIIIKITKKNKTGDDANAPSTKTPPGKHVIYEVGVRPFTAAGWGASEKEKDAEEALRGTFAGLAAKAPYLASLGVTAVELLPIFEYDELEFR